MAITAKKKEIVVIGLPSRVISDLSEQIRRLGAEPVWIASGAEGRKHLVGRPAGLVVVVIDGMTDPMELIRELIFLFRGLPVVALSDKGNVNEARETIAAGAADYLLAPITLEMVQELLKRYAYQYFDPELGRGRRLIYADVAMDKLLAQVRRVARSKATVLIHGESGTGKELIARYVHQISDRASGPFVAVNCAALPDNLLESELFGHVKGAFTGALAEHKGRFQQANSGTILLDEISEMSLNLQAKLLRVLQEGEVDPVGGRVTISLDVRVVASTNRNLKQWVVEGKFREDLFYRLNVFPVILPALRARPDDILLLAEHFRKRMVIELGRNDIRFSKDAMSALRGYSWPGNVRELENVVQRALLVAEGNEIAREDLMIEFQSPPVSPSEPENKGWHMPVGTTVAEMEEILIMRTLDEVAGNRTRAAELLGISIRTLRNKLN